MSGTRFCDLMCFVSAVTASFAARLISSANSTTTHDSPAARYFGSSMYIAKAITSLRVGFLLCRYIL